MLLEEQDRSYVLRTFKESLMMRITDEAVSIVYQDALRLLGNLVYYQDNGSYRAADVVKVMRALVAEQGIE